MNRFLIIGILFTLAFCACESKEQKVRSNWKYVEGFHFGDFLSFENPSLRIENDTVYQDSKPFALIEELKTEYFPGTENKLILKDIRSGKLGTYADKGKNTSH